MKTDYDKLSYELLQKYDLLALPIDINSLLEKLNIKVSIQPLSEKLCCIDQRDKDKIIILLSDKLNNNREFLSHIIGHYVLENLQINSIHVDKNILYKNNNHNKNEYESTMFLKSLLIPRHHLINIIQKSEIGTSFDEIERLSMLFNVNIILMTSRLVDLKII